VAIERLTHIGLCVSDLARSKRFYGEALGFAERSDLAVSGPTVDTLLELDDVELSAVYLERDGVLLELLHFASPGHVGPNARRPMNQLGLTHLSFRVSDLDAVVARVQRAGAHVVDATRIDNPEVGASAVFVCDPDGTRIELVQSRARS
jgi:catechol 2,3-dioxygenase-like lactoylglutathione lyase family enzyme